jgi:pimeloyl-ACP methyl ester carboxylesterase
MTEKISPFRIDIPQAALDDLNARLAETRWPDELPDVGWNYGIPTSHLRELTEYWRTSYDWRKHEAALTEFPQCITEIQGQRLHFAHIESRNPNALPLVLVHGWPFEDFRQVTGPLSDDFHLVIPTLPGFGFSGPTRKVGDASTERCAELIAELMARLGYQRYGAQGGDAGAFVFAQLGRIDTEHVVGVHLNGPLTIPASDDDGAQYSADDQEKLAQLQQDWSSADTMSYALIHSTRPQTLAPAVTDSPVGLLGWVLDVVHTYANEHIDTDVLLTNISILWFTSTIGSSMRLYKESKQWDAQLDSSGVPTGIAIFRGDMTIRGIAEKQNNVVQWSEFHRGGHFAAMETPGLLAADVTKFFGKVH